MYNQKMIEGKKELARKTVELAKTAFDTMQKMQQLQFDAEQKALDNRMQAVQLASQQEMRAIDATTAFQVEKDNKKAEAAARTAAKENEIRQQSNNLLLRRAQADKQAAEARIIAETASAIIQTVAAYASIPGGFVIAAGLSAIIAAMGAAQYAAVSATPLPQYAEGTGDHRGGFAVIGDGGEPEFVTTPTGRNFWSKSTSTIVDLPAHSTVTPLSKMQQYAANMVGGDYYSTMTGGGGEKNTMTDKRIVEEIQELRTDLVKAMLIEKKINNTVILKQNNNLQRPIY